MTLRETLGRWSDRLLMIAAVFLMLSMLACVFFGVVFRQLNMPLAWTDEAATYLMVWTAFVGMVIAGNRRAHIRITVLSNLFKGRAHKVLEIVTQLLVMVFGAILLTQSWGLIQRNLDVEWVSLPLTVAVVYMPLPLVGLAVFLQSALAIRDTLQGNDVPPPPEGLPL